MLEQVAQSTFSSRFADLVRSLSAPLMRRPKSARTMVMYVSGVLCDKYAGYRMRLNTSGTSNYGQIGDIAGQRLKFFRSAY